MLLHVISAPLPPNTVFSPIHFISPIALESIPFFPALLSLCTPHPLVQDSIISHLDYFNSLLNRLPGSGLTPRFSQGDLFETQILSLPCLKTSVPLSLKCSIQTPSPPIQRSRGQTDALLSTPPPQHVAQTATLTELLLNAFIMASQLSLKLYLSLTASHDCYS